LVTLSQLLIQFLHLGREEQMRCLRKLFLDVQINQRVSPDPYPVLLEETLASS
jgi:hypothetical protein